MTKELNMESNLPTYEETVSAIQDELLKAKSMLRDLVYVQHDVSVEVYTILSNVNRADSLLKSLLE